MDKVFLQERKIAVKQIALMQESIKKSISDIEELADKYGIRVDIEGLPATGYNGDAWYMPNPPVQMQEGTEEYDTFDPSGTDWQWEQSTREHSYSDEPFGWQNSSSSC